MSFRFPSPLYPIADAGIAGEAKVAELAEAIVAAGVPLFQLRVKERPTRVFVELARRVKTIADRGGALLIVNDRADVARLIDAAGVHLGQEDIDPAAARAILGPGKIIGFSTHNAEQLRCALQRSCIDYVAYGPIFPTRSKERPDPVQGLEALRAVARRASLPLVAIGGIRLETIGQVIEAGADAAAVIGAIGQSSDPRAATRALLCRAEAAPKDLRPRRRS
jgi:thiamine-phosphate pyrophosphorylase